MAEGDPGAELARLSDKLKQFQDKVVQQWSGKELDQYLQKRRLTHEQWLKDATDELSAIKGQLMQQSAQNKEAVEVQKRKADEIELALRDASEKRQKLLSQKEQLTNQIREQTQVNEKEKDLLEAQQEATRSRLRELTKAEGFFKDRMGLRFKKLDSDNLQFVFTDVDPKDHERVFYFTVKVDKEYQVTDCCPQVAGWEDHLQQLNKSNNLMEFVVAMRQKFKLSC